MEAVHAGRPFAVNDRRLRRGEEQRFELLGPEPAADATGRGLEVGLTGDFNHAGEFWGRIWLAEFDRKADGSRANYLGLPHEVRLGPSTARYWEFPVPGRDGDEYRVRVEMDYDFWLKSELSRPRFLHRPKYLR